MATVERPRKVHSPQNISVDEVTDRAAGKWVRLKRYWH